MPEADTSYVIRLDAGLRQDQMKGLTVDSADHVAKASFRSQG